MSGSSEMLRRVDCWFVTNISEEIDASNFNDEGSAILISVDTKLSDYKA